MTSLKHGAVLGGQAFLENPRNRLHIAQTGQITATPGSPMQTERPITTPCSVTACAVSVTPGSRNTRLETNLRIKGHLTPTPFRK